MRVLQVLVQLPALGTMSGGLHQQRCSMMSFQHILCGCCSPPKSAIVFAS